ATTSGKNISCKIPPYRFDIFGPMDLVEEVALGYGVEKLTPLLSSSETLGMVNPISSKLKSLSLTMVGLGYLEALNSSLTSKRILFEMTNREPKNPISVLDSKSQEHTILRDSILPGLLENLSRNIHAQYPQKLFETGTVFSKNDPVDEKTNFAAVWAHQDANFSEMKSILQAVLKTDFNLKIETKTATHETFEKGRTASILVDGKIVGIMGEINSNTIENYKIRVPVSGFEIDLSGLIFD
ncbi:MAG: phenylalanine--tRNA ligase subunit beta, partial [Nitrosopumilaceae archaeon]